MKDEEELSNSLNGLGTFFQLLFVNDLNDIRSGQRAEQCFLECQKVRERIHSKELGPVFVSLAEHYLSRQDDSLLLQALYYLDQSIKVYSTMQGPETTRLCYPLKSLAKLFPCAVLC